MDAILSSTAISAIKTCHYGKTILPPAWEVMFLFATKSFSFGLKKLKIKKIQRRIHASAAKRPLQLDPNSFRLNFICVDYNFHMADV